MRFFSLFLVFLLLTGCQAQTGTAQPDNLLQLLQAENALLTEELNELKTDLENERSMVRELEEIIEQAAIGGQVVNNTDNDFIGPLVADAFGRYWRVEFGSDGTGEMFEEGGVHYRYYPDDIDTLEKMTSYLNEVYTEGVSSLLTRNRQSKDARLYHHDGALGTLMNWERATVLFFDTYPDGKSKTTLMKIPTVDGHYEVETIKLFYLEGKGWRVGSIPSY